MALFDNSLTMKTMHMLEKGLDTSVLRREVVANNIANVDVPHFKRSEVSFEMNLKRALDSEKKAAEFPHLQTNHAKHIQGIRPVDYRAVRPKVHTDYSSEMRNDGNNVDIEDEVSRLVRNQMRYNLMVDRLGGNFRLLNQLTRLA